MISTNIFLLLSYFLSTFISSFATLALWSYSLFLINKHSRVACIVMETSRKLYTKIIKWSQWIYLIMHYSLQFLFQMFLNRLLDEFHCHYGKLIRQHKRFTNCNAILKILSAKNVQKSESLTKKNKYEIAQAHKTFRFNQCWASDWLNLLGQKSTQRKVQNAMKSESKEVMAFSLYNFRFWGFSQPTILQQHIHLWNI